MTTYTVFFGGRETEFYLLFSALQFARSLAVHFETNVRVLERSPNEKYSIEYTVSKDA